MNLNKEEVFSDFYRNYWFLDINEIANKEIYKNQIAAFEYCWGYLSSHIECKKIDILFLKKDIDKISERLKEKTDANASKRAVINKQDKYINKLLIENKKLKALIDWLWENEPEKTEMLDKIQEYLENKND